MSKTKFVMRVRVSGTRNGEPWPNIGEPLPAGLSDAEVADMVACGHVGEAIDAESDSPAERVDVDAPAEGEAGDTAAAPARRTRKSASKA